MPLLRDFAEFAESFSVIQLCANNIILCHLQYLKSIANIMNVKRKPENCTFAQRFFEVTV